MSRFFKDFDGWWIIVLFFLFLVFQDCWQEISLKDWIPFLILLLILVAFDDDDHEVCCKK
jgi:hypothetical protein